MLAFPDRFAVRTSGHTAPVWRALQVQHRCRRALNMIASGTRQGRCQQRRRGSCSRSPRLRLSAPCLVIDSVEHHELTVIGGICSRPSCCAHATICVRQPRPRCRMFEPILKLDAPSAAEKLDRIPAFVGRAAVDQALRIVMPSGDHLIGRALSNAAHAMLTEGCPIEALACALAAVRCGAGSARQKALYRAGAACAAVSQPQAALYFLDQVCFPSICHSSPLRCAQRAAVGAVPRAPRSTAPTRCTFTSAAA